MIGLYDEALQVALQADVSTPPDRLVLYSISFLASDENKRQAEAFLAQNPEFVMLDQTPAGRQLVALGLLGQDTGLRAEQIARIWSTASQRLIKAASGNITAFVTAADSRSVFRSCELPAILNNPQIITINACPKVEFAENI